MTDVRLEDIQQTLSTWARQETALKDHNRLLEARIEELTLLVEHGIKQVVESFDLPEHPNPTLRLVVEEATVAVANRGADNVRLIASQKDSIERLETKVAGLEKEIQDTIDRLTKALELLPNKHRTLRSATSEVVEMVLDAKQMVRENL